MKKFGSLLFLGLAAVGCSHSPNTDVAVDAAKFNAVTYLNKSDRLPAGAPELLWRLGSVPVKVTTQSQTASAKVEVNQEMVWIEKESFQDVKNEYREYDVPGQCSDFVCSAGSGKSVLWDSFFSATKEKKAAALANAIQGVGSVSAEALVTKKVFASKPATWQAFAKEINRAADQGVITKSVATGVLTTYKYENIANLGYARESCREVVNSCTLTISKLVAVPFTNYRDVERRKVVSTKTFTVNIEVAGSVLMAKEVDNLTFKIDENGKAVSISDTGAFNRYVIAEQAVEGNVVAIVAKATSRVLRDISANVVRQDSYQLIGGVATFVLDIDAQYVPTEEDPNSQLVVDYQVRTCKYGWTGLCGFGWDIATLASAPLTQARTVIPMKVDVQHKSDIVYTISRKNSLFFNDKPTRERSTDTVKMPK